MTEEKKPFVISIAAVSGGGKTTITDQLNKELRNSKALFFDEYDLDGPNDISKWVNNGSDYEEWNLAPLIKDLRKSLAECHDFIVMDFPFAYKHSQARKFIDLAVFVDTPLDIALVRRMTRDHKNSSSKELLIDMEQYISYGRSGYLEMLQTIRSNSDLIIDGSLPVAAVVNKIYKNIK